jgi:hypothetical protein
MTTRPTTPLVARLAVPPRNGRPVIRRLLTVLCCLAAAGLARAAVNTPDLLSGLPPVIEDTTRAAQCTVTYLVTDITTNDMIAVRMQISPDPNDRPVGDLMPCPANVPPRVASRALDACVARAADPRDCVFADMGRDFEKRPIVDNTAENTSRCRSDKATDIGVACWRSGQLQVCDVSCGGSPTAATAAAVSRCEAKQQRQCPISGSVPVLAPR